MFRYSFVLLATVVLIGLSLNTLLRHNQQPNHSMNNFPQEPAPMSTDSSADEPWQPKTEEQWREILSPEEFKVTRQKGTERAFTGKYWDSKKKGIYRCRCCDLPIFSSQTKYKSGTGWPSFWQPLSEENVKTESDNTLFMRRTEVLCRRCNAHLGHVFPDGPQPTGLRYCLNSVSLRLEESDPDATAP